MRVYRPGLGRFLSVDPLSASFPWNSSYSFAENDVIRSIDLDGKEKSIVTHLYSEADGKSFLKKVSSDKYVAPDDVTAVGHTYTTKERIAIALVTC
jgi:hypothetical protein